MTGRSVPPLLILLIAIGVPLYLLPLIVASRRKVPNVGSIAVINIFLGWMLVAWVIALAMAVRTKPQDYRYSPASSDAPPFDDVSIALDEDRIERHGQVLHDTSRWSNEELAVVLSSLDRRGITVQIHDDTVAVDEEAQDLAARIIAETVDADAITSSSNDTPDQRETLYSTETWSDDQLDEIVDRLEGRGVPSYMDEGHLVIDKRWEQAADTIISTVTRNQVDRNL